MPNVAKRPNCSATKQFLGFVLNNFIQHFKRRAIFRSQRIETGTGRVRVLTLSRSSCERVDFQILFKPCGCFIAYTDYHPSRESLPRSGSSVT